MSWTKLYLPFQEGVSRSLPRTGPFHRRTPPSRLSLPIHLPPSVAAHHLKAQGSKATPLDYARDTIQHWAQRHMSHPGHHSICSGDFNSPWTMDEDGGGGYRFPLQDWSMAVGWRSRRDDLPFLPKCITRPSCQLTGGSEIDHVLCNSPAMRLRH